MKVQEFALGPLPTNGFLVTCEATGAAMLIDPGWPDDQLAAVVSSVVLIVNTHTHWDHIGGNAQMVEATGAPLLMHEEAIPMLNAGGGASMFGAEVPESPPPERLIAPGDVLEVGELRFEVRYTPGHAPGHISLVGHGAVFSGDVLFNKGVGRTDLPGGSWPRLRQSIEEELLTLPDETIVYCGHGPNTTIGEERQFNPFL